MKFRKLNAYRIEISKKPNVGATYKKNIGMFNVGLTCPELKTNIVILKPNQIQYNEKEKPNKSMILPK